MRSMIPVLSLSVLLLTACSSEKGTDAAPPGSTVDNTSGGSYASVDMTGTEVGATELNSISTTVAKEIVLRRASVSESEIQGYKVVSNMDKGYLEYQITFWVGTVQHYYALLGSDGSVVSFSTVFHESGYDPSLEEEEVEELVEEQEFVAASDKLSSDKVRELIAAHANITASSMKMVVITEGMNGSIPQYEVTFATDAATYRYTLSSSTGMIFTSTKEDLVVEDSGLELNTNTTTTPSITTTPSTTETITPSTTTTPTVPETTTPSVPETTTPSTPSTPSTGETSAPSVDTTPSAPVETTPSTPSTPSTAEPETITPPIYGENVGMAG